MRHITYTPWKRKVVTGLIAPMSLAFLFAGCGHQPIVKPLSGVTPVDSQEDAVRYCKAETTSSWTEKFELLKKSQDTLAGAGRDAGSVSDLVTKDQNHAGTQTGESVGNVLGTIGGIAAIIQNDKIEDQRFAVCMEEKGYRVIQS